MTDQATQTASPLVPSPIIEGVFTVPIKAFGDDRGRFMETFRREWFPWVNWDRFQTNRSQSKAGVLRGLHYHFHQIDYWYVVSGVIRAGLVDLRPASPTYMAAQTLEMGGDNNTGLFIPIGVAHGFYTITDCNLTYIVNNYYDGKDELGVAWNDPQFDLAWDAGDPLISGRDAANPLLKDVPPDQLPR